MAGQGQQPASASLRTADDYRAEAREFDRLARQSRDPQLKKHYVDLAVAFRELAKAREQVAVRRTRAPAKPR
jgi:hypothetical protein